LKPIFNTIYLYWEWM